MPKISVGESSTVALISCIEKVWRRGGGGVSRFSVDFFYLTVPKISVVESTVGLISGSEKVWRRRRGEYQDFPSKTFCSQCRNFQ